MMLIHEYPTEIHTWACALRYMWLWVSGTFVISSKVEITQVVINFEKVNRLQYTPIVG